MVQQNPCKQRGSIMLWASSSHMPYSEEPKGVRTPRRRCDGIPTCLQPQCNELRPKLSSSMASCTTSPAGLSCRPPPPCRRTRRQRRSCTRRRRGHSKLATDARILKPCILHISSTVSRKRQVRKLRVSM